MQYMYFKWKTLSLCGIVSLEKSTLYPSFLLFFFFVFFYDMLFFFCVCFLEPYLPILLSPPLLLFVTGASLCARVALFHCISSSIFLLLSLFLSLSLSRSLALSLYLSLSLFIPTSITQTLPSCLLCRRPRGSSFLFGFVSRFV